MPSRAKSKSFFPMQSVWSTLPLPPTHSLQYFDTAFDLGDYQLNVGDMDWESPELGSPELHDCVTKDPDEFFGHKSRQRDQSPSSSDTNLESTWIISIRPAQYVSTGGPSNPDDWDHPSFDTEFQYDGVIWHGQIIPPHVIQQRYEIKYDSPLGSGSSGTVYEAIDRVTCELFALKVVIEISSPKTELSAIQDVCRSDPVNAHVIRVYDFWIHNSEKECLKRNYIKMERCDGTLEQYLRSFQKHEEIQLNEITEILIQILDGLAHCHMKGRCHRDLKLTNILYINDSCQCHRVDGRNYPKRWVLTDFGFSTAVRSGSIGFSDGRHGTGGYRAPELLKIAYDKDGREQPATYTQRADIWAIGVIIMEVATTSRSSVFGHGPAGDAAVLNFANGDDSRLPQLKEGDNTSLRCRILCPQRQCIMPVWQHLNFIIQSCLDRIPDKRPTSKSLIQFFLDYRKILSDYAKDGASEHVSSTERQSNCKSDTYTNNVSRSSDVPANL